MFKHACPNDAGSRLVLNLELCAPGSSKSTKTTIVLKHLAIMAVMVVAIVILIIVFILFLGFICYLLNERLKEHETPAKVKLSSEAKDTDLISSTMKTHTFDQILKREEKSNYGQQMDVQRLKFPSPNQGSPTN